MGMGMGAMGMGGMGMGGMGMGMMPQPNLEYNSGEGESEEGDPNSDDLVAAGNFRHEVFDSLSEIRVKNDCKSVKKQAIEIANAVMKVQSKKIMRELMAYLIKNKFLIGTTEIKLTRALRKRVFGLMEGFSSLQHDQLRFVKDSANDLLGEYSDDDQEKAFDQMLTQTNTNVPQKPAAAKIVYPTDMTNADDQGKDDTSQDGDQQDGYDAPQVEYSGQMPQYYAPTVSAPKVYVNTNSSPKTYVHKTYINTNQGQSQDGAMSLASPPTDWTDSVGSSADMSPTTAYVNSQDYPDIDAMDAKDTAQEKTLEDEFKKKMKAKKMVK